VKRSEVLEKKLVALRYAKAVATVGSRLRPLGIWLGETEVKSREATEQEFQLFLQALRAASESKSSLTCLDQPVVQKYLESLAVYVGALRATWFMRSGAEVVGVVVPAAKLLRSAMRYEISGQHDLMLCDDGASGGICVELNHITTGDELEVVAWGSFVSGCSLRCHGAPCR
jgi:hypothetical protein